MIFINKFADYSGNKIGTIEIPQEIDPTAEAIMSKYTKQLTSHQQLAFSQLIYGMKAAGIYSKVEFLYLPCLAASVSEAFYEAINDVAQDMTDTDTYGQYSVDSNGLKSVYNPNKTYTNKLMSITRSTYGGTLSSLMHLSETSCLYGYMLSFGVQGHGCKAGVVASNRNYMTLGMKDNKTTTDTFTTNAGGKASIVHSFMPNETSWLPSALNSKAICNGETATITANTIDSAMSVSKTSELSLASYSAYGSSFDCKGGTLDILAISSVLHGVPCIDNSSKNMDVRMDELLTTFKSTFFA